MCTLMLDYYENQSIHSHFNRWPSKFIHTFMINQFCHYIHHSNTRKYQTYLSDVKVSAEFQLAS